MNHHSLLAQARLFSFEVRVTKKQLNNLLRRESPALETEKTLNPSILSSFDFKLLFSVLDWKKPIIDKTSFHLLNTKSVLNFCSCLSDPCLVLWTNHKGWSNRSCASCWRVEVSLTIQSLWRVDVLSWWHVMAKMGVQTIYAQALMTLGWKLELSQIFLPKFAPLASPHCSKRAKSGLNKPVSTSVSCPFFALA